MSKQETDGDFSGEHVVVTGGGSGIGAEIALAFRRCGATVTVMGRNESRLKAFASDNDVEYAIVDVTDESSVKSAFSSAVARSSAVSILVNNAGIAEAKPFTKCDSAFWQKTIATNLNGVFHCTAEVVPSMLEARHGRIINIASTAAKTGYAYVSAYCASKHGVLGLTRSLALEFARSGITVNAICPGYTDTDIVARSIEKISAATGRSEEEALAELLKSNPQGRLISPQEVANTALWLARKQSESVTGQAIAVAGGEIM
ncbi:MAG: SDR family oxidoreductase [Gammaproteobacteria bacterium]|nr:SDR family oxidoreductase [Gammaproteobacteria bacterium]